MIVEVTGAVVREGKVEQNLPNHNKFSQLAENKNNNNASPAGVVNKSNQLVVKNTTDTTAFYKLLKIVDGCYFGRPFPSYPESEPRDIQQLLQLQIKAARNPVRLQLGGCKSQFSSVPSTKYKTCSPTTDPVRAL
ncbi:uncharacterized protein LOC119767463 [Culex quinquefasciatus]|uniref:uncharacterized protein LOC119767463 n=1 Tax=Culex quinquefasciatus TaxID=7176 RepID=UPI0018E3D29C|nr:uncharacterized protein LOC119767463 [Culex quinquefasciatus]